MAFTEVLLIKPVDGLGAEGEQVRVRAGFARNMSLNIFRNQITYY